MSIYTTIHSNFNKQQGYSLETNKGNITFILIIHVWLALTGMTSWVEFNRKWTDVLCSYLPAEWFICIIIDNDPNDPWPSCLFSRSIKKSFRAFAYNTCWRYSDRNLSCWAKFRKHEMRIKVTLECLRDNLRLGLFPKISRYDAAAHRTNVLNQYFCLVNIFKPKNIDLRRKFVQDIRACLLRIYLECQQGVKNIQNWNY